MNWTATQERLAADKGQWSRIARATGLHINAVRKIALGETPSPRIDTVQKIVAYYDEQDRSTPAENAAA